jgi:glycine/D-amino acid oxidase-like deaminating enzyme
MTHSVGTQDKPASPPKASDDAANADVIIVGGGVMGAATACFLARDHGLRVTVLERDPSYRRASSALSASSIRQQFSTPVNIALSAWSVEFLRRVPQELAVEGEPPPAIGLVEPGYLYLATPAGVEALEANHLVQREAGAEVTLLNAAALQARFPWLRVDDLAAGSLGLRGEGWFDGPALHQAFRRKAIACGARFVVADVVGFESSSRTAAPEPQPAHAPDQRPAHPSASPSAPTTAHPSAHLSAVRTRCGQRFEASAFVLAAGAWTAPLAAQLGVALPVAGKKRDVFVLDSPAAPLAGCPLVIDPSGVWFRPEGRGFIAGAPPRAVEAGGPGDPDEPPLDAIDHALFDEVIWPTLATRVPAFEALRVRSAWAGYYEMNGFDHNGLAGALPGWSNAFTACGFSGHGMQQAPAVGRALAALIAGRPTNDLMIDLTNDLANDRIINLTNDRMKGPSIAALAPDRILHNRPLRERNVI